MLNPFLKSIIQEIGNNPYLPTLLSKITILIVVTNKADRDRYVQYLQSNVVNGARSYCFLEAETIEEGLNLWRQSPDMVLLDLDLPDGLGFLTAIADHAEDTNLPVIVLTEQSNEGMAARAMKLGAVDYLIKEDITEISLSDCVHRVCGRIARIRQLQAKIDHLQSEQQRASILLSESEQRYNSLASSAPVGIFRKDRLGQCIYVNDRYCQIAGLTPEAALGEGWREGLHLDDREMLIAAWQQSIQDNHRPFQLEYRFQHTDGKVVWVYGQCVTERDDNGEVLSYVGTLTDISDRKQAELDLKQSEFQSRAILATIPDLMFRVGSDGIYRGFVANRDFGILLQDSDPTGQAMTDLLSPEIAKQQLDSMQQALQTGELQVYEQQIQIGDRLQDEEVRVIKCGDDEVLFMIRNISDRKQAEAALKKSEMTNRAIIEAMPDLLIQMDLQGRHISMLAGSSVRVHRSSTKTDTIEIHDILPADLAAQRLHYANQAIATSSLQVYEQIFIFEDEQRYEEVRIAPLNDFEVLVIIRDITDAKQAEVERLHNAELLRSNRLKDEFLANMSHELRTPLNSILGMTEALLEQVFGNVNERQIKALQTIERGGSHLLELITDILDIAKIESGQMELDCKPTAIESLCQSSLTFVRQQAIAKRIRIKTQFPTNLPDLLVDELRIRQVLINLLNNAVKFTMEEGQITLAVAFISQSDDLLDMNNYLQIAITDTGIGISAENINKLFQPFIQIDSALNRKYQGTGLGLALVKQIVELHGGTVRLKSEVGVGSCFTVALPYVDHVTAAPALNTQAEPTSEPSPLDRDKKFSILIAEDNAANVATISSYLEAHGYRLLFAKNGLEAIAVAQKELPDLILMDMQMPIMGGLESINQIRQIPSLVNLPIIALTALAMTSDRDRCLAAGANEYMPKPVKLRALAQMIQRLLESI
jgi:PAS domain S-box-containing protein